MAPILFPNQFCLQQDTNLDSLDEAGSLVIPAEPAHWIDDSIHIPQLHPVHLAVELIEMYYIELATGLRRGELLGLKWSDIDWKNGIIKVRRQVARVNGEIVEAPLKTKNSYRVVSISPQAIKVLREQKRKTKDTYVFPSPNGGPISPDSVNNMLKRVLERAGIPKVRFHDLRHTFATIALQNGVDIKTVSGMLGHFSAGFTLDTYAHVTTSAQKEAAQTIGNVLSL